MRIFCRQVIWRIVAKSGEYAKRLESRHSLRHIRRISGLVLSNLEAFQGPLKAIAHEKQVFDLRLIQLLPRDGSDLLARKLPTITHS